MKSFALWPRHRLGREILAVLVVKLVLLWLAAAFVFNAARRPQLTPAKVEAHMLSDREAAVASSANSLTARSLRP